MNKSLLLVVATTLGNNGSTHWKEGCMYYRAEIKNGEIFLPDMCLDEKLTREAAKEAGMPLSTYLEKGIMNDPMLLKKCRINRVGYQQIPQPVDNYVPSKEIEEQRWNKFIINILQKKNDTVNLQKYIKRLSGRFNEKMLIHG